MSIRRSGATVILTYYAKEVRRRVGRAGDCKVVTLWLFNIAMENGPFIDDFPIKTSIYKGFFHGYVK